VGGERCGLRHPVRYTDRSELRSPLAFFSNLQADAADVAKTKIVDLPYEELTCMHVPPTHTRARTRIHARACAHTLAAVARFLPVVSIASSFAGTTDPNAPFGVVTLASSGAEGSDAAMGAMRIAQTASF
jgi:hypothetical protein